MRIFRGNIRKLTLDRNNSFNNNNMKIFVSGSLRNIEKNQDLCEKFVEKLGETIMKRKHILLTGCSGSLDKKIAESSASFIGNDKDCQQQIHSYLAEDQEGQKAHNVGRITLSELKNWNMEQIGSVVPEQIKFADVSIFIAGKEGTIKGSNFSKNEGKPILGIGTFGGAGKEINKEYRQDFEEKYSHLIHPLSYDDLNQVTQDLESFAVKVVDICEKIVKSKDVFCVMSFKDEYEDVFDVYKTICEENELKAIRTDHDPNLNPITNRILEGIKNSDFIIADVSEMSPNVFYEIGYAHGIKRPVIITAKKNTTLPFDINDFPVIFYDRLNLKHDLEPVLEKYIKNQIYKA